MLAGFAYSPAQTVTADSELKRIIDNLRPFEIGRDEFFPRSIVKDSNGFIWIGLRNSLLRFDGDSYTEFGYHPVTNRGMITAGPEIIREHPNGDLWIASWTAGVATFDRNTQTFQRFYPDRDDPNALSSEHISDVHISQTGDVWIGTRDFVLHKYRPESGDFQSFPCPLPDLAINNNIEQTHFGEILTDPMDENVLWIGTQFGLFKFSIEQEAFDYIQIDSFVHNRYAVRPSPLYIDGHRRIWFGHFNREGLKVFDIPSKTWIKKYTTGKEFELSAGSYRMLNIYPILDSFVIAHSWWNHFIMVNTNNLEDFSIQPYRTSRWSNQGLYVDEESNEMLLGLNSQLLRFGEIPRRFPFFAFSQFIGFGLIGNFQRDIYHDTANGQYLISTEGGDGVLKLSEELDDMEIVRYKSKVGFEFLDATMLAMVPRNDSVFIASDEGLLVLDPARESIFPYLGECHPGHFTQVPLLHAIERSGTFWVAIKSGGIAPVGCASDSILGKDFICQRIRVINDTLFALATDRGLVLFQPDKYEFLQGYTDSLSLRLLTEYEIWDLEWDNGTLWVGTRGNGLAQMTMQSDGSFDTKFYVSGADQGSNIINGVLVTKEGELWTASDFGISNININTGEFENYGLADGVGFVRRGPFLHELATGQICASANGGWHMFDPETLRASYAPVTPYLKEIEVMGHSYDLSALSASGTLSMRADDDYVSFVMGALNPNAGQIHNNYRYRLIGYDDDWVIGYSDPVARYTKLPGGKYTFQFTASPKGERWSEEVVSIEVDVAYKFTESPFFKAGAAIAILILLLAVYRIYQLRRKRNIERLEMQAQVLMLEKDIAQAEINSLRAQMNPHFIHNALNSINWYILKGRPEEAREYLVKFSRLIRLILENSKTETISLAEELNTVQLYIELEAMRFDDSFQWSLQVDEKLNAEKTRLPAMIIQPFVENAIWHGLLPKEGDKRLEIAVFRKEDVCCIEIRDNGVGRSASNDANQDKPKSRGIEITRQRLENFGLNGIVDPLHIIDLKSNGTASGTLVRINLPLVYSRVGRD